MSAATHFCWARTPTSCTSTHFRRQFASTLDLLDHLILSHEVGHMKPAPEFYAACVSAAGVPAGVCIFIDDLEENVDGARRAGLIGLHYVDTPTLIADLDRLGMASSMSGSVAVTRRGRRQRDIRSSYQKPLWHDRRLTSSIQRTNCY